MKYQIKEWSHSSRPNKIKLFCRLGFPIILQRNVKFHENCEYDLNGIDQLDINKLFGVSQWFHQKNSARFGWRWNLDSKQIELHSYVYSSGKLIVKHIVDVGVNQEVVCRIAYYKDNVILSVFDTFGHLYGHAKTEIKDLSWFRFGYWLKPYFGGNRTATHEMHIEIS